MYLQKVKAKKLRENKLFLLASWRSLKKERDPDPMVGDSTDLLNRIRSKMSGIRNTGIQNGLSTWLWRKTHPLKMGNIEGKVPLHLLCGLLVPLVHGTPEHRIIKGMVARDENLYLHLGLLKLVSASYMSSHKFIINNRSCSNIWTAIRALTKSNTTVSVGTHLGCLAQQAAHWAKLWQLRQILRSSMTSDQCYEGNNFLIAFPSIFIICSWLGWLVMLFSTKNTSDRGTTTYILGHKKYPSFETTYSAHLVPASWYTCVTSFI